MSLSSSRLTNEHKTLVLDASVTINVLGTGRAADVLRSLNRQILMDEFAVREVKTDPSSKLSGYDAVAALAQHGLMAPLQLSVSAFDIFLDLTGAPSPDDLGDGEAATLAQALDIGAVPVIDERKATRIAAARYPGKPVFHSIDLLACSEVIAWFSHKELAELVFSALISARMRVPVDCRNWVVGLIGLERASQCRSLGPTQFL